MSNTPEATPPPAHAEVLIVEDSLTQALRLQRVLEQQDYRVTVTRNGREALDALGARRPTLVITDINMPEMDGYELCRRIKDDATICELPVILLTSLSDPEDILKGLECGADNFIVKPYDEEFLLARIQSVLANLELRKQARGGGQATEIFFAGQKYQLKSERIHSIDLLLSTYETAVQKNLELSRAKETLEQQAEQLREKNAEMQADLEMARELQTAFLPKAAPMFPPHVEPGQSALRFCHRYFTTTELGGDFFDILPLSDTEAGVFVCDVMGHGVRAALVTAMIRGLVEELKPAALDPGRFLTEVNQALCSILMQTQTPLFATACYLIVDTVRGELRFANAGHPAPFHVQRGTGRVETLSGSSKPSPALGIFDGSLYRTTAQHPLAVGDLVMLYTDGLYEVEGPEDTLYTKNQLFAAVTKRVGEPTPQLFDGLIEEIKDFALQKDFEDDVCVVGIDLVTGLTISN